MQTSELQIGLDMAKELVAQGEALSRLMSNRDFKKIILGTYLKDEPVRLTGLLAGMVNDRAEIQGNLLAISQFRQFLTHVEQIGKMAASEVAEYEAALAEDALDGEAA